MGLVLGGGGARGLAHIGVLKVLEQEKVPIDLLAGTSMGGLIGALYAAGISPAEVEEEAIRRGRKRSLARLLDLQPSPSGLVKGKRISEELAMHLGLGLNFRDLKLPLALMTVDLRSGQEVVLREGSVIEAVRATISLPGFFVPVDLDGHRLVDGGVLNNVPVDVAKEMGAEVVFAVDVLPDFSQNQPGQQPRVHGLQTPLLPRPARGLWHVQLIMLSALTEFRLKETPPQVIIRPQLPVDMDVLFGFERSAEAVAAGEIAARAALTDIWNCLPGKAGPG